MCHYVQIERLGFVKLFPHPFGNILSSVAHINKMHLSGSRRTDDESRFCLGGNQKHAESSMKSKSTIHQAPKKKTLSFSLQTMSVLRVSQCVLLPNV